MNFKEPGQHPKVLEAHAVVIVVVVKFGRNKVVLVRAIVVTAVTLVTTDERFGVVVGQLDPGVSLLCTLVPGQQPNVLKVHEAPVLVVFSCDKSRVVVDLSLVGIGT